MEIYLQFVDSRSLRRFENSTENVSKLTAKGDVSRESFLFFVEKSFFSVMFLMRVSCFLLRRVSSQWCFSWLTTRSPFSHLLSWKAMLGPSLNVWLYRVVRKLAAMKSHRKECSDRRYSYITFNNETTPRWGVIRHMLPVAEHVFATCPVNTCNWSRGRASTLRVCRM